MPCKHSVPAAQATLAVPAEHRSILKKKKAKFDAL
jgi:hypothetical protein